MAAMIPCWVCLGQPQYQYAKQISPLPRPLFLLTRHLHRWKASIWPGWETPSMPQPSPESLFWVYPASGLLAASLERRVTGPSLTGMWLSLGTCPAHVLLYEGAGCPKVLRWFFCDPTVILASCTGF